ncbi:MAG: 2-oxoacid:acceptor oxidoreductase family protein [Peptococcaceae bacterium]|jgi:pyruvate ferredoxin oxidoreductase gamma subunit|nr:2-oxoacid:acceptor oxidoreductase family protein [Peptococcaceae bacterium]
MLELRIHGRGGQGVVTLAELLAQAVLKTGQEVQTLPFFGVERRGAAVKAALRLDSQPILVRSLSYRPNMIVLLNENLLSLALSEGAAEDVFFAANARSPLPVNAAQWLVDATGVAVQNQLIFAGEPFINVPMLGALCRILDVPEPAMESAIREQWEEKTARPNLAAAGQAYHSVIKIQGGAA